MYCSASATDWIRSSCLMVVMGGFSASTHRFVRRTSRLLCRTRPGRTKRRPHAAAVMVGTASRSEAVFGRHHPGADIGVGGDVVRVGLDVVVVVIGAQAEVR